MDFRPKPWASWGRMTDMRLGGGVGWEGCILKEVLSRASVWIDPRDRLPTPSLRKPTFLLMKLDEMRTQGSAEGEQGALRRLRLPRLHSYGQSFLGAWVSLQTSSPSTCLKLPAQWQPGAVG